MNLPVTAGDAADSRLVHEIPAALPALQMPACPGIELLWATSAVCNGSAAELQKWPEMQDFSMPASARLPVLEEALPCV